MKRASAVKQKAAKRQCYWNQGRHLPPFPVPRSPFLVAFLISPVFGDRLGKARISIAAMGGGKAHLANQDMVMYVKKKKRPTFFFFFFLLRITCLLSSTHLVSCAEGAQRVLHIATFTKAKVMQTVPSVSPFGQPVTRRSIEVRQQNI